MKKKTFLETRPQVVQVGLELAMFFLPLPTSTQVIGLCIGLCSAGGSCKQQTPSTN